MKLYIYVLYNSRVSTGSDISSLFLNLTVFEQLKAIQINNC